MHHPTVVKVWIAGHPQGGNWRKRAHWRSIKREDDLWKNTARVCGLDAVNRAGVKSVPFGKCIVTVTFCYPENRRRDWDNMSGELKGLFDGLTGVVWKDDDTKCILELIQRIEVGQRDGLEIAIEPLQVSLF